MSALCAVTAAWLSFGTASAVIWSLRPPLGACTASACVTFPLLTVNRTCTAPYCVWTALPVTVPDPAAAAPPWADAPACCGGAAAAPAGSVAGFSDSSSTTPDTVAAVASTTRRMGWLFFIVPDSRELRSFP
ncbi:hypothetical protein [Streptomyces griseus]|uniref:hypothetical protein n=1 Tax=Streptomyces griseus TaxID=1911 RepID=UPI00373AF40F